MKNHASGTAEGIAYMRYYESLRPERERVCYDPLAYSFSAWWVKLTAKLCRPIPRTFMDWAMERKGMGISGFIAVRTRFFDDFFQEELDSGAEQIVILGAGLDSRAYRFRERLGDRKVFEVDHPLSQAAKKQRVVKHFGQLPDAVSYVSVDFTKDDLLESLVKAGYDTKRRTLFTLEGVLGYLDKASARKTLDMILKHSGGGSAVMFDYVYAGALDGRIKSRVIAHMNSLKFIFHESIQFGIEKDYVDDFLKTMGYDSAEDFSPERLYDRYLKPCVPNRAISDVYGIAIGRKK